MSASSSDDAPVAAESRFTVDVVTYHVLFRTAAERAERVVLRRTVFTEAPDGGEVSVEQLWTSTTTARGQSLLGVVRGIAGIVRGLVLGEPVVVPDLVPVTGASADELDALVDRAAGGATTNGTAAGWVERLVGFRGTVDVGDDTRTLVDAVLACPPSGLLGQPVRTAFRRVIAELGCTGDGGGADDERAPDGDADDGEPLGVADALRMDVRDARTRDDEHTLWVRLADARLVPPIGSPTEPGPVFTRWPRRTADGTTLSPPDEVRPDLDAMAVTFIEITVDDVDGLQVGERRLVNLFRYRLDRRVDLHSVLRQEAVRRAFAAYAASGGHPDLQQDAIDALLDAAAPQESDWRRHDRRTDSLSGSSSGSVDWLSGTVVFTDCRGVQIGNRCLQYNTFAFTVAPDMNAAALLRDHLDLVESIVDYTCRIDGPPRHELARSLHDAVCGSAVDDVVDVDLVGRVARAVERVFDTERRAQDRSRAAGEMRRAQEERRQAQRWHWHDQRALAPGPEPEEAEVVEVSFLPEPE